MIALRHPDTVDLPHADDVRLSSWLRAAGIAAIVAAALGSVLVASPAMPGAPSTGTTCTADLSGNWIFRNCDDSPRVSAP